MLIQLLFVITFIFLSIEVVLSTFISCNESMNCIGTRIHHDTYKNLSIKSSLQLSSNQMSPLEKEPADKSLLSTTTTTNDDMIEKYTNNKDALAFIQQAQLLRQQADLIRQELENEKTKKLIKYNAQVDKRIEDLLFHNMTITSPSSQSSRNGTIGNTSNSNDDDYIETAIQLLNSENDVAQLIIDKRLNEEHINQMFDRICEKSSQRQSIDKCSPLISLLLDAACKVDCLEREENPNKRWNHRVERRLRKKLFALGWGIHLDDVERDRNVRSISGEKDIF